ncbi:hypothetical protein K0M31_020056 [Melipona bicolor]|uniref:Uncharacterized protein n=1 Tax=Melipona bicolor TaxID=60889 RepID=A0AA40KQK5_9HYME|nr:hypothetical protein K0M31_020056 [Melipona bicolor]
MTRQGSDCKRIEQTVLVYTKRPHSSTGDAINSVRFSGNSSNKRVTLSRGTREELDRDPDFDDIDVVGFIWEDFTVVRHDGEHSKAIGFNFNSFNFQNRQNSPESCTFILN